MTNLFITILNISITATYIAFAVMLARLLFKRSPKWISCLLWAIVAIRLLVPFSVESKFSLVPEAAINNIKIESITKTEPQKESNVSSITPTQSPDTDTSTIIPDNSQNPQNNTGNPESPTTPSAPITPVSPSIDTNTNDNKEINKTPVAPTTSSKDDTSAREKVYTILSYVWIGGTALMLVYCTISFLHLRKKVQISLETEKGIFICDNVNSPFILGIIRPKIFLPSTLGNEEKAHIIAHEKAHLKRCDHLWKPFGFVLLSLHWFNPIMWLAYILLCRDIEFACDEKVMKSFGNEHKKDYSKTLLECSIERKTIAACPLAFGEVGVKQRIQNVLNYRKPAFWVTVTALILCVAISFCFLTNPVSKSESNNEKTNKEDVTNNTPEIDILNEETSYNINATELIYDNPLFSYTQEAIDVPTYRLVNCSQFQEVILSGSGYNVKHIGDVYTALLHYDAFKKTFVDYSTGFAKGYSIDFLLSNNETSVNVHTDTNYYQLLKQKDNTHYLVVGHVTKDDTTLDPDTYYNSTDAYATPVTYTVRWIYKVELTPAKEASMVLRDPEEGENSIEFLYQESLEEDNQKHSHLTLYPVSKTFDFSLSVLGSYYPSGNYKIRGNKLTLECSDSDNVYVFRILGSNSLEFIESESSELPKYKYSESDTTATPPFEDGATFTSYGMTYMTNGAKFDIDGDGTDEFCSVTTNSTSSNQEQMYLRYCEPAFDNTEYKYIEIPDITIDTSRNTASCFYLKNAGGKLYLFIEKNIGTRDVYELSYSDGSITAVYTVFMDIIDFNIDSDSVIETLTITPFYAYSSKGLPFSITIQENGVQEYLNSFDLSDCISVHFETESDRLYLIAINSMSLERRYEVIISNGSITLNKSKFTN